MHDNDFTGFKFNGIHFTIFPYTEETDVIKLARVSDGDRYNMELLPQSQDATVNVPGGDGTYYFGTNFTGKTFVINFAFDSLSEADLRTLRQTFAKRNELAPLIFDEEPYKYWMVKCVGMPSIKTICFNGDEKLPDPVDMFEENSYPFYKAFEFGQLGDRIYKGEGTVEFVAYYPFARCGSNGTSKWGTSYVTLPSYIQTGKIYAPTKEQWFAAASLCSSQGVYDQFAWEEAGTGSLHKTLLYNPGDMTADFSIVIGVPTSYSASYERLIGIRAADATILSDNPDYELRSTKLSELTAAVATHSDNAVIYNTRTRLLEGCTVATTSSGNKIITLSGNVYNRFIDEAHSNLTGIPLGEKKLSVPTGFTIEKLDYDYIYY